MKTHDVQCKLYDDNGELIYTGFITITIDYIDDSFDYEYGSIKETQHVTPYYELICIKPFVFNKEKINYHNHIINYLKNNEELAINIALQEIEEIELEGYNG